jgi:uncharacterized protein with HEPN domain
MKTEEVVYKLNKLLIILITFIFVNGCIANKQLVTDSGKKVPVTLDATYKTFVVAQNLRSTTLSMLNIVYEKTKHLPEDKQVLTSDNLKTIKALDDKIVIALGKISLGLDIWYEAIEQDIPEIFTSNQTRTIKEMKYLIGQLNELVEITNELIGNEIELALVEALLKSVNAFMLLGGI